MNNPEDFLCRAWNVHNNVKHNAVHWNIGVTKIPEDRGAPGNAQVLS
jgi:hypothetical protein